MPPPDRSHPVEDIADVLLRRVRQMARRAERTASSSAHAVEFAKEMIEHRSDFRAALATLRRVDAEDAHELFVLEVKRAYAKQPRRLAAAQHRTDLLIEWSTLLVESLSAVEASLAHRPANFHEHLDEDDLAIMEEERQLDGDLGARGISEAWQA